MPWLLPPLPDLALLADLCREAAAKTGIQPQLIEKDFHLTRLLGMLGQLLGPGALLKGGTLLSKVDLGFFRMSEDADLVVPGEASRIGRANATLLTPFRLALLSLEETLGARILLPGGERFEHNAHVVWELGYASEFGRQVIKVEATIRPVLRPPRAVALGQLLQDPLAGDAAGASCFALEADEARAEKVRAACTREAIRDFYDLDRLLESGADLSSPGFLQLVDAKLLEIGALPLARQGRSFGLTRERRSKLERAVEADLPGVLRQGAPGFDLEAMLRRFNLLWRLPI
jgi:predicted nucleotidyltransferase component of viral defense system